MGEWMEFIRGVGVPVALLFLLLFEAKVLGQWVAREVVKPVVKSHQDLLIQLGDGQRRINRRITALCNRIDKFVGVLNREHDDKDQPPGINNKGA